MQPPNSGVLGAGGSHIHFGDMAGSLVANTIVQGGRVSLNITAKLGTPAHLEQLMYEIADGSKRAFAELYDVIAPRVLGIIRRSLLDPAQSEEVAQDVFLEIWQTSARYDAARGKALTWILTMANRRAIDRVRASQASRDRDMRIGLRDREIEYDTVVEAAEIGAAHRAAKAAFGSLTPLQRESLELAYDHGLSQNEIADRLGVPVSTVKTRIRDGLIRLRHQLQP